MSIPLLAFALLTASFLWPTEDAISGGGLHIVVLWFLLGALHFVQRWWETDDKPTRKVPLHWMDVGVLLIAVGHVISTVTVFQVSGDRRAALNLTFEWIGLLIAWRILRTLFQNSQIAAQGISVMIAICVGLGCYGIWQHHFYYPEQRDWYLSQRTELDQATTTEDRAQFFRINEITRQFQERNIPMSGSSRILWENRLLNSSEPFATFSLANTLAGILATGLVLLIGRAFSAIDDQRKASWLNKILLLIQLCLIAYCLILTKSRSAWLGSCVGFGILLIRRIRLSAVKQAFRWTVGGSLAAAIAIGIAFIAGGIDKEVILESPRSLQFRLLYWAGTARMLQEQPLTGAGPGNFRQVYLRYKLDETSEEIRDPHNFVLDAWSSSGLIGLTGLLLIIGCTGWYLIRHVNTTGIKEQPRDVSTRSTPNRRRLRLAAGGILIGFVLHVIWTWVNGSDEWISEPIRLLLLVGLLLMSTRGSASSRMADSATCFAAASAMMINLLAAGGFEMPTVMITLLVCLTAGLASEATLTPPQIRSGKSAILAAGACLLACLVVFRFGVWPITISEYYVRAGNSMIAKAQNPTRALEQFQLAALADPQSVTPRQRIAEVLSYRLSEAVALRAAAAAGREGIDEAESRLAENALQACEDLILADHRNSFNYRLRSEVRWNASLLTGDLHLQNLAIQDLRTAATQYPSSVAVWYQLAERLVAAGSKYSGEAKISAERALQLDQLNHEWGHSDRYLNEEQNHFAKRITEN
jgi:hypothetical protein